MKQVDCVVIGGGVIGTAVARSFLKNKKGKKLLLLEKEPKPALHTSGRNSGVLHSGINLKPGSLKATLCVEGNKKLREFCLEKKLPFDPVGTLVVAINDSQIPILEELKRRGDANGTPNVQIVSQKELAEKEPYALGVAALYSPSGAIASGKEVTLALADEVAQLGGEIFFSEKVIGIEDKNSKYIVKTSSQVIETENLFNCAGLYADEIAHMVGVGLDYSIIPFRGEYFKVSNSKKDFIKSMIYPIPDLNYPFLGVHWTKMVTGELMIGPSATIAMGRESYKNTQIGIKDVFSMITKRNFWNLFRTEDFRRLAKTQIALSFSRKRFIAEAQKLVRGFEVSDFVMGKNGNRAQLVRSNGKLVDDMIVEKKGNSVHVLNAVSPGFTCALPFADYLIDQMFN
ncbi:MAG: L-2-hydroxyglutarate oxidase [Elusimicrobiota bacterium]